MKADPKTQLHVVDTVGPVRRASLLTPFTHILCVCVFLFGSYLLNSYSSFSNMRMGPVELRMMRGCPPKTQNTVPAKAVPRKLSITPLGRRREQAVD